MVATFVVIAVVYQIINHIRIVPDRVVVVAAEAYAARVAPEVALQAVEARVAVAVVAAAVD